MKKGVSPSPRVDRIVDGEHGERQLSVPVVLAPIREGAQCVADDAVGALDLGVGVLVVRRADDQAGAHALGEGPEHVARELGVVIDDQHVRKPVAGAVSHVANDLRGLGRHCRRPGGNGMNFTRQEVNMGLYHVKVPLGRRQPGNPVHPNHPTPMRREGQRMEEAARAAVFRLGPLASLARAYVLGNVNVLSHPEGEAAN